VKRKPTLRDVAKMAGVSTATVSNVLNDSKNVGGEAKQRIHNAVRTLNYIPNNLAKSLRMKKSKLIGLMISDISNPFFPPVVRGIEDVLAKNGFNVLLCDTDSDPEKERRYLKVLLGRRIDGLIVSLAGAEDAHFRDLDLPVVFFNRIPDEGPFNTVETENVEGGLLAADHLAKHGFRRIAVIAGPQHLSVGKERLVGFLNGIAKNGLPTDQRLIAVCPFTADAGYRAMESFMALPEPPEAVFTCNNALTIGAFRFLREGGFSIPRDIALIGYDDLDWTTLVEPPLTVIRHPGFEMGLETGKLIMECLRNQESRIPRRISMRLDLEIRRSCGCGE
jgi:LacI family transcriptional regulator